MSQKLCTVIIPVYNCAETIAEAVKSALNQTYRKLELLIVNDCSTDQTLDIVQKLSSNDNRIHIINNKSNMGVANARNQALKLAKGDYIAFLDGDDVWETSKVERQIFTIENSKCDFCYTSYSYINKNGVKIGKPKIVPNSCAYSDILKENFICCSSVLMHGYLKKYEMMDEFFHEDFVYWLGLLKNGYTASGCTTPLVKYRVWQNGRSNNKIRAAKNRWAIYRKYCNIDFLSAIYFFCIYAFRGIVKYSNL